MGSFSIEEWYLINAGRVARLATIGVGGQPHVLPVVYVSDGERIYTPLDGKPKRVALDKLQRVRDIRANNLVALVIDHYEEDWAQLAWVQIRGRAEVLTDGAIYAAGIELLRQKYAQYTHVALLDRPLIVITPEQVRSWRATEGGP